MASIKVKFKPFTIEGKEGSIYYQIIQIRVIRQLKTDYRIFTDEWNEAGSCIIVGSSERNNLLLSLQERMEWNLKRLDMIIRQLDNRKAGYTADDIIAYFQSNAEGQSFFNFMQGIIARLKQMGKIRTTLSKILCKWKQDSVVSLFLYLDSVFKHKHKLIHNQAPV